MSTDTPDWEEIKLRLQAVLLRRQATMAETAIRVRRFARAWQAAERRETDRVLFEHPDVVEVDMSAARWWDCS
jgi:hypothetical protein